MDQEQAKRKIRGRSLKRLGVPADLVGTLIYLASGDSDLLTGHRAAELRDDIVNVLVVVRKLLAILPFGIGEISGEAVFIHPGDERGEAWRSDLEVHPAVGTFERAGSGPP